MPVLSMGLILTKVEIDFKFDLNSPKIGYLASKMPIDEI